MKTSLQFKITIVCLTLILTSHVVSAGHHKKGENADGPKAGLLPLFNGKDISGFKTQGNWVVEKEGVLTIRPREDETGWKRFDAYLWSEKQYADFEIELEYQHGKKGNSGFFFRVADPDDPVPTGLEVQILDSFGLKKELSHHDCGGIIKTSAPKENAAKPAGEWNHLYVKAKGNKVTVILNGRKVNEVDLATTKSKDKPTKGYIGLQDHGQVMHFRNIKFASLD